MTDDRTCRIAAFRAAGMSLEQIGTGVGLSRERVRYETATAA